jgi:5-methylcytosine-specific restriction enzyme A
VNPTLKPCIEQLPNGRMCGVLFPSEGGWNRCLAHRKGRDRPRFYGSSSSRDYGYRWQKLRKRILEEHLARFGLACPGWHRSQHFVNSTRELQLDHIVARVEGGTDDPVNLQILCRSCNSAKSARESTSAPRLDPPSGGDPPPSPPKPRPFFVR